MALKRIWLLGGLLLAGCVFASPNAGLPAASTAAAAATPLPTETAPPSPALPPLDEAALANATVTLPETGPVTLTDGLWTEGDRRVRLLRWAPGQLSGGEPGAVAALSLNLGGSGNFVYLAAFANRDGKASQLGEALPLEDRADLEHLSIQNARVMLTAWLHWGDDPSCCPGKHVRLTYRTDETGLWLETLSAETGEDVWREISLSDAEAEADALHLRGQVRVVPFENTLVYRWRTADGALWAEGSFMVQPDNAETMGGPGSFDIRLPWPDVPAGRALWLEILEPSMRDGSPLALYAIRVR